MKEVKIKSSDLNAICELAKIILENSVYNSMVNRKSYKILVIAQQPLQEADPKNI